MTQVTLALAPQWFEDRDLVALYFLGLLYRSARRRDFSVDFVETNDYGALGVVTCEPDSDYAVCAIAANRLSDAMAFRDASDPFAEARKLSQEDRKDRAKIEKLIDDYLIDRDRLEAF
jgi:hypothetical protein